MVQPTENGNRDDLSTYPVARVRTDRGPLMDFLRIRGHPVYRSIGFLKTAAQSTPEPPPKVHECAALCLHLALASLTDVAERCTAKAPALESRRAGVDAAVGARQCAMGRRGMLSERVRGRLSYPSACEGHRA